MSGPSFVRVWRFWDAPPEFQALSTNGGDEDWIVSTDGDAQAQVEVAEAIAERLAVCDYQRVEHSGEVVFITCHA